MPEQDVLLQFPPQPEPAATATPSAPLPSPAPPKLIPIDRNQQAWVAVDVEQLIDADHKMRVIWDLTGRLDLSRFASTIRTHCGESGRPTWDPRVLISVWLYAYSLGITSARQIERCLEYDPALRWLTGLQVINHHTLSDFRVDYGEPLNDLFVQLLVALENIGLVTLEQVMHDGTKVRARAGSDSFRRENTVQEKLAQTRALVTEDPQASGDGDQKRRQAARRRAQREQEQKAKKALEELTKLQESKTSEADKQAVRVSLTEPEARLMKHGDNAIAPSYNVQVTTDAKAGAVVGVHVTQSSDDSHSLLPAMDVVRNNLGRDPLQAVADGGFTNRDNIEQMDQRPIDFLGSLPDPKERSEASMKAAGIDPHYAPHYFTVQPENNTLLCPEGKVLEHVGPSQKRGNQYQEYRANGNDCQSCAHQKQCCPRAPEKGRTVSLLEKENEAVAKFRQKMTSAEAQAIYGRRGAVAEFPFAEIKERFRLRKFRVFGKAKAELEALWACLTYNVMIWCRWQRMQRSAAVPVA
jgi:transposase